MAIATNCPNCNAKFNLADDLEGKTVKCKRCQNSFVVPAADAIASKPPRSSAREEEDDDDDRPAPPPLRKSRRRDDDDDEDEKDDREDDDEPRRRRPRRRSESRERRGRKKSGGSSMMAIVLILVGVGMLFLVCCGVGGVVAFVKMREPGGPAANTRVVLGADGTFQHANRLSRFDNIKDGKRFRTYTMRMEAGKSYQFDMTSDQLDSFLFIIDDIGNIVALDDDGGGFPNARIVFRPQRTGEYQIQTTSFMNGESGTFLLTVRRF